MHADCNGASARIVDDALAQREVAAAQAEFRERFPTFCRTLNITPAMLSKLPTQVAEMLVMMRMFNLLSIKIMELDGRILPVTAEQEARQ